MHSSTRFLSLAAILLAGSVIPIRANLGETIKQVVARYGNPVGYAEASAKSPFGNVVFKEGSYNLVLFILDGREVGARMSKTDKGPITDAEIQFIMSGDSDGTKWTPVTSVDPACSQWTRSDKATVLYDRDKHLLIFTSDAMAQALKSPPVPAPTPTPVPTPAPAPAN
jgi:hypothetical protein